MAFAGRSECGLQRPPFSQTRVASSGMFQNQEVFVRRTTNILTPKRYLSYSNFAALRQMPFSLAWLGLCRPFMILNGE
jgi:hypothetical protein